MNLEQVEQVVAVFGEYPLSEITIEQNGRRIHIHRPLAFAPPEVPAPLPALAGPGEEAGQAEPPRTLSAPMVGIFFHAEPPVPYAALVRVGQVIGFIESMKLMNEVVAEDAGRVTDVLAEDGAPVEYGQPLFRLAA